MSACPRILAGKPGSPLTSILTTPINAETVSVATHYTNYYAI